MKEEELFERYRKWDDPPEPESEEEMVDHPEHYNKGKIEVIDIIEDLSFCKGNAVKYVLRAEHKGEEIRDLRKAVWYLGREIAKLEKDE